MHARDLASRPCSVNQGKRGGSQLATGASEGVKCKETGRLRSLTRQKQAHEKLLVLTHSLVEATQKETVGNDAFEFWALRALTKDSKREYDRCEWCSVPKIDTLAL